MRQGTRDLAEALAAAAAMDELAARDVAAIAEVVARGGSPAAAETLRALSGIHERRAREARSKLALLTERYGHFLQGGHPPDHGIAEPEPCQGRWAQNEKGPTGSLQ